MTKEDLLNEGFEDIICFENPDYGDSIIGIDTDGRVVYSLEKMANNLSKADHISFEEALEFIDYNAAKSLPYVEGGPIIVKLMEDIDE